MILIGRQLDFTLEVKSWDQLESEEEGNKKRVQHGQNHSMCSCQDTDPEGTVRKEAVPESSQRREAESAETEGCEESDTISGGHNEGVPPVPIPNTEVKPFSAESTWLDTAREHRSPPDSLIPQ